MLLYLGFPKVQTAELESLGVRRATSFEEAPTKNAPMWTAHPDRALQVEAKELLLSLKGPRRENFHLIDVRSPKEYFARHGKTDVYVLPDLQALNIEWKEFFTADGRPNRNLRKKLESVQVHPTDRVIVISNHGLRSAAATYALKALGYMNVGNFSGGWDELKAHAHKRIKR
jgi:thiosulfate/3-mercaptopyruvate sulfurtransferase